MMSTRPSALAPCSMKLLASSSFRRSADIATILRPVSLEISFAAASSGSLRRAQIATSTPSRASVRAMPLPMPSLPPVISAVLPLSLRSIVSSRKLFWWFVREPAAGLGRCKEIGKRRIQGHRFLGNKRVAGTRNNQETRRGYRALQEHAAIERPVILIADNDQQRDGKLFQIGF